MNDYAPEHQRLRRAWAPIVAAGGVRCWRCNRSIRPGQPWDLGHDDDTGHYRGPECPPCNRAAGARKGNALRRERKVRRMILTRCALAVEVAADRRHVSIAAAGDHQGSATVELADYLTGAADVVDAVRRIHRHRSVIVTVVDPHSHGSNLIKALRAAGITVAEPSTADVMAAHGELLDRINAGRLRHVSSPQLDAAIRAGNERRLGGGAAWDRRTDRAVDVSPARACDLALWGWDNPPPAPAEPWAVWGEPVRTVGPPESQSVGALPGMTPRGPLSPPPTPRGLPNVRRL